MPTGIRKRMLLYYLVVVTIIIIFMGIFFTRFLREFYLQTLREDLLKQSRLAASLLNGEGGDAGAGEVEALVATLARDLGVRVTLVGISGQVLEDSAQDPALMDNHLDRPEIIDALRWGEGVAVRYSTTLDESMVYVAVPLFTAVPPSQEGASALVRLAIPLTRIDRAAQQVRLFTLIALMVSSLIAMGLAAVLSQRIVHPIRRIGQAAQAIAGGDFTPPLAIPGRDELTSLAGNIREMGASLKSRMDEVLFEKSKLEAVVSSMTSGMVLTDSELNIELINPAATHAFGVAQASVLGVPLQKALRYYALYEHAKAVRQDGQQRKMELNLYYPRAAVLETHLLPLVGPHGKPAGVLLIFQEVTHLRSAERMRSDFVANASHELRTPLTMIRGYAETLRDGTLTTEDAHEFLQIIERETIRLSHLLDSLLDLAQIEHGKGYMKREPVNLTTLVADALERVEELRLEAGTTIRVDAGLPGELVVGNYEWLCQAVVNILENSIKYGRKPGSVTVKLSRWQNRATVGIADDGPGIPPADLPYVFERFYRVDKARSRQSGGTGLGLAIVKHIMEAHDAVYTLESQEGVGTVFSFSLPLQS